MQIVKKTKTNLPSQSAKQYENKKIFANHLKLMAFRKPLESDDEESETPVTKTNGNCFQ